MQTSAEWRAAVDEWGAHLERTGRAAATVAGYVKHLGWLAEATPAGPWELTTAQLAAWLEERNWSADTRRKVVTSFRLFYAWAVAEGLCEWAPVAGLGSAVPAKRGPARRVLPPAWAEPVESFLAAMRAAGRSDGTLQVRLWWLGRLAEVAADPWTVTTEQLTAWLSNPDWSAETKRAGRASVRAFYRWATTSGRVEQSPAYRLPSVLVPRTLPKPTPDEALRDALAVADDRVRLALLLGALAGLRRAEIAGLHTRQITEVDILVVGKGDHHRRVPLHPLLRQELDAELARRRRGTHGTGWSGPFVSDTGWLFPSDKDPARPITAEHLGKLISRALPDEWTAHTLRHRFASLTYAHERDLLAVQTLLGHVRPETTARYAAVPDGALTRAVAAVGL